MTSADKLQIIFPEEGEEHPKCAHGPTILFSVQNEKYFACSFFRNMKNKCFYLNFNAPRQPATNRQSPVKHVDELDKHRLNFEDVVKLDLCKRIFCINCKCFVNDRKFHKHHNLKIGVTDDVLQNPSYFLKQLDCDKLNAQYFFDTTTCQFLDHVLTQLNIDRVVCIGAPRFNDFVKSSGKKQSFLLDIDERYRSFNNSQHFARYNMCNNFFFIDSEQSKLEKFLNESSNNSRSSPECRICLFLDPPFGCRTELIASSIQDISELYRKTNNHRKILPIFWIFPYYQEKYIKQVMPQMEMMDFEISYDNHKAFNRSSKARKEGSPIRAFTNVDLSLISYTVECQREYSFCQLCSKFVSVKNKHCTLCGICPSKNGATYKHCKKCRVCVKPNYTHCDTCARCVQQSSHNCSSLQKRWKVAAVKHRWEFSREDECGILHVNVRSLIQEEER